MTIKTNGEGNGLSPLRIVIADDIQATLHSTRLMFTLIPEVEVVEVARSGREAIEKVKKYQPDIVLMDVNMPEMNGIVAAKKMLQLYPQLACIIMSSEGDSLTRQKAKIAGARDFLLKPFTLDQLIKAIHLIIEEAGNKKKPQKQTGRLSRRAQLENLANEYAKKRRTDQKAMVVFEELAASPDCDLLWLKMLAMNYVVHMQWNKLKFLADRIEKQTRVLQTIPNL